MSSVEAVYSPEEIEIATRRLTEIRFDAIVRMYDSGQRTVKFGLLNENEKSLPPQHFAIKQTITLESIKHEKPEILGRMLKDMYRQLEDYIEKYEK